MKITIHGDKELIRKLKTCADAKAVHTVLQKDGALMQRTAMQTVPVRTGNLKRSIGLNVTDKEATVEPTADYAGYVEFGTRYMSAQPYMKPAFDTASKQFESDLKKLVR